MKRNYTAGPMTSAALRRIESLDPRIDYEEICRLDLLYEFPFDTARSLEFALFRTFCSPSIGATLDTTKEFELRAQRRYDDTDLLLSEIMEGGIGSERGLRAVRRMNQLHGRYRISNEDLLYVLSTFVLEPIRWNARFGWRPLIEKEKLALFTFWLALGRRMNIRDIPVTLEDLQQLNVDYERRNFRYSDASRRVGEATREMFLAWFLPRLLRPAGRPFIHAILDDPVLEAFGWRRPPRFLRALVSGALKLRARASRLLPARREPRVRTVIRHRTYAEGYVIEDLGPSEPAWSSPFLRRHVE